MAKWVFLSMSLALNIYIFFFLESSQPDLVNLLVLSAEVYTITGWFDLFYFKKNTELIWVTTSLMYVMILAVILALAINSILF